MEQTPEFLLGALQHLQRRVERAAERYADMRHMVVLSPGEAILIPHRQFVRRSEYDGRQRKIRECQFGDTTLDVPLPPKRTWPKALQPLCAVIAKRSFTPLVSDDQKPHRTHLFFGGSSSALRFLRDLAKSLYEIKDDLARAVHGYPGCLLYDLFYCDPECPQGLTVERLDSWLCTVHWWSWTWAECPFRTQPYVVYDQQAIAAHRCDESVLLRLSFSYIDENIFTASAAILGLMQKFFEVRPAPYRELDYPFVYQKEAAAEKGDALSDSAAVQTNGASTKGSTQSDGSVSSVESTGLSAETGGAANQDVAAVLDDLVTLGQVAPLTGLNKRTLDRYRSTGAIPEPDIRGGGGRAHKWFWRRLRIPLANVAKRPLPEQFPWSQFVRATTEDDDTHGSTD